MSTTDLSDVPPRLRRDVGLLPLFMVSAGSVIGSGWLLGALHVSEAAGPAAIISWGIGVVLLTGTGIAVGIAGIFLVHRAEPVRHQVDGAHQYRRHVLEDPDPHPDHHLHSDRAYPGSLGESTYHAIDIQPATLAARAAGSGTGQVNSHHHQGVDLIAEGAAVTAFAVADGLPEALEWPASRFALGVQWHPEAMPIDNAIGALVGAARPELATQAAS